MGLRSAGLLGCAILIGCGTRETSSGEARAPFLATSERDGAAAEGADAIDAEAEDAEAATAEAPDATAAREAEAPRACPDEMALVDGMYCASPSQVCKRWVDPVGPYQFYRCAEYAEPATCAGKREKKRFCIDREELVQPPDALPLAHQSWTSASALCSAEGKRLCLESEWQFACEGEEVRPYPYGFKRDATACNIDRTNLGKVQEGLKDLRAPVSEYPRCLSPFGVHNMSGNVEEWTTLDALSAIVPAPGAKVDRGAMKGAWWLPGKNTCRAVTTGHGETYEGPQVGVRCCKDAPTPTPTPTGD